MDHYVNQSNVNSVAYDADANNRSNKTNPDVL